MTNFADHEIHISAPAEGETRWTVTAYGNGYALERLLDKHEDLRGIVEHDPEAGCYFGYTLYHEDATKVADRLLELQKGETRRKRINSQAQLENQITEAASALEDQHGYTIEDLIKILTSKEG